MSGHRQTPTDPLQLTLLVLEDHLRVLHREYANLDILYVNLRTALAEASVALTDLQNRINDAQKLSTSTRTPA